MDIKPTKPSLPQETSEALNPKGGFSDLSSILSQFNIRTMNEDLGAATKTTAKEGPSVPTPAPKPILPPVPPTPVPPAPKPAPAPLEKMPAIKEILEIKPLLDKIQKEESSRPTPIFAPTKTAAAPVNLPTTEEKVLPKPAAPPPAASAPSVPPLAKPEIPVPPAPKPILPPVPPTPVPPAPKPAPAPAKPVLPDLIFDKPAAAPKPGATPTKTPTTETEELDVKKIIIFSLAGIAVLALIIWGLWYFLAPSGPSQTPTPSAATSFLPTQTPSPSPSLPAPLFEADSAKILELKTGQEKANFQEALAQLAQTDEPTNDLVQLAFRDGTGQFPSLLKIASSTGLDFFDLPTQAAVGPLRNQLIPTSFTFFLYSQGSASSSPFASSFNSGRLGLVAKINIATSTATSDLAKSLKDLEQLMPQGLKFLLPGAATLPAKPTWLDNTYKNVAVRYVNFPDAALSLDYAILGDKLIFATSKDSMYAMIDRLLMPATSPNAAPATTP